MSEEEYKRKYELLIDDWNDLSQRFQKLQRDTNFIRNKVDLFKEFDKKLVPIKEDINTLIDTINLLGEKIEKQNEGVEE